MEISDIRHKFTKDTGLLYFQNNDDKMKFIPNIDYLHWLEKQYICTIKNLDKLKELLDEV